MKRRDFIKFLGGTAAPFVSPFGTRAQQAPNKIPVVGVLWHAGSAEEEGAYFEAVVQGFRALGYIDGRNVILEHRFPNEIPEHFRSMARELVALNVDILIGVGSATALYLREATTAIPIIFIYIPDPVGVKLVASLARPGGNVTGLTNFAADLIGKRLHLLKEMIPGLSRVALLVNPNAQVARLYTDVTRAAAARLQLTDQVFEARSRNELEPTFDAMVKAEMQAVTISA
jgi:putative ABC transport system substrate-binding protein